MSAGTTGISPTRILAIRHGETAWNAGSVIMGHEDIPLNEKGKHQAELLAQALAQNPDVDVHAVYSSDLVSGVE